MIVNAAQNWHSARQVGADPGRYRVTAVFAGRGVMLEGAGEYAEIPLAISVWTGGRGMFGSGLGDRRRKVPGQIPCRSCGLHALGVQIQACFLF